MRKFTENQPLLASIDANDKDEIKLTLINNIFFLQGDQDEINKAAEFAEKKSDFKFDKHEELEVSNKSSKEDYFSDEKWNMKANFSRERYNILIKLYHETFAQQEYTYESTNTAQDNQALKKIIIGGAVVIAGYLLFKALS